MSEHDAFERFMAIGLAHTADKHAARLIEMEEQVASLRKANVILSVAILIQSLIGIVAAIARMVAP